MNKKRGQVWVETVIYTLIALALIGTVLAFVKPKVEEMQDKIKDYYSNPWNFAPEDVTSVQKHLEFKSVSFKPLYKYWKIIKIKKVKP